MGGWKDACDAQPITSDRWQELAAVWVAEAVLMAANGYQTRTKLAVLQAGAYIRAWRKSLPEQGSVRRPDMAPHRDDEPDWDDDALLWFALRHVGYAQYHQPINVSGYLRQAEAALRTWWRRQVAS